MEYQLPRAGCLSCGGCLALLLSISLLATALISISLLPPHSLITAFSSSGNSKTTTHNLSETYYRTEFSKFTLQHHKNYLTEGEREERYKLFKAHVDFINSHNEDSSGSYKLSLNPTGDWTSEEFRKYRTCSPTLDTLFPGGRMPRSTSHAPDYGLHADVHIDWSDKLPPIKDQCMCGSCWTFSGIASLEGLYAIKNNNTIISLSEQLMVDCCADPYYPRNEGCFGGWFEDVFDFAGQFGVTTEGDYPYLAINSVCRKDKVKLFKVSNGYTPVTTNDQDAMLKAVNSQPVSISISAADWAFRFYKSGILDHGCGHSLGHAVNAVGAGEEGGKKYWLVRNSWGPNWGDKGYLKVLREPGPNNPGVCGVAINVAYPNQ